MEDIMNKKLIITTLAFCFLVAGSFTAAAYQSHGHGPGVQSMNGPESPETGRRCQSRGPQHEMMAEILGLTDGQRGKIAAIHQESRTANEPLQAKMQAYKDEMRTLLSQDPVDEDAVRAIAAEKAAIQAELAISRAQTKNDALAVMTPEQQDLAKKLQAMRQNGGQGRHRGHGKW